MAPAVAMGFSYCGKEPTASFYGGETERHHRETDCVKDQAAARVAGASGAAAGCARRLFAKAATSGDSTSRWNTQPATTAAATKPANNTGAGNSAGSGKRTVSLARSESAG